MPVTINLRDETIEVAPRQNRVTVAERDSGVRIIQPGPPGPPGPPGEGGGGTANLIVVSDLADIPPGTPAGTGILLSAGAPVAVPSVVAVSSIFEGTSFEVVLPAPSTVADGDLLLAVIGNQTPNAVEAGNGGEMSTIPAGFTRVAWTPYPTDAGIRWLAVYAKTAAGESGDYRFAWNTTYGRALGALVVLRGADTVLDYVGPKSQADNIPVLPSVAVATSGTLALGIVHTITTAGNDGRVSFPGWDSVVQVVGDWTTASSNALTIVSRAYASGETAGGDTGTLNQGTVSADANATLLLGLA